MPEEDIEGLLHKVPVVTLSADEVRQNPGRDEVKEDVMEFADVGCRTGRAGASNFKDDYSSEDDSDEQEDD